MKELQHNSPDQIKMAVEQQVKKQKQTDQLIPYPGQKLWELNETTGEIKEVSFDSSEVNFETQEAHHKATRKDGCDYVLAINRKNAEKKFLGAIRERAKNG